MSPSLLFAISEISLVTGFATGEKHVMALLLSAAAVKALLGMPKREREQLKARLDAIAAAPVAQHASVAALQGEPRGRFRVRQGDYRAVFRIDGADVVVDRIGHRREVYER